MAKVAPAGDQGPPPPKPGVDDSDTDDEPGAEAPDPPSEDDEAAPHDKYCIKIPGLADGDVDLDEEKESGPPPVEEKEEPQEPPMETFRDISNMTEPEVRDAMLRYVKENCCYGKGAAIDMKYDKVHPDTGYHYTLETYGEKRTTSWQEKPHNQGDPCDGPENGTPPGPWDMTCVCRELWKNQCVNLETPHTSVVHQCKRCKCTGKITCGRCTGRGTRRCGVCRGRGSKRVKTKHGYRRRTCWTCGGDGRITCGRCSGSGKITCPKCKGCCYVRVYLELKVNFVNHLDWGVYETTEMPNELIRDGTGTTILQDERLLVHPITTFKFEAVNVQSKKLTNLHLERYKSERILMQRHKLDAVPVCEVDFTFGDDKGQFWVYGHERKVYAPTYPHQCCWGCEIL